jgi:two-component system, NtrC family, nitrogen regulation sensor histidine kinase NtrY
VIHLIVLIGLSCLTTYCFVYGPNEVCLLTCVIILIDSLILIHSFNRTNRSLAYFFESVENEDTQLRLYSRKKNKSIQRLYDSMNRVNKLITDTKFQNQRNEQYYKALIQQSATGLIAMSQTNTIEIANDKACELVGILVPVNFKRLENKNPELWSILCTIKPGETETHKIFRNSIYLHLLIRATGLRFYDREIKLISIQDIKHELDAKETESWQKLISILTHEIMNSIAPITSLTTTLTRFFIKDDKPVPAVEINTKVIANTIQGLEIIGERGNGLLNFVTSYRRLTKIPQPVFNSFSPSDWLNNIKILLFEKLEENQVTFEINIDKHLHTINGDEKLLTQVILNLIYNAIYALCERKENRKIKVIIERNVQKQVQITVTNNGAIIPAEIQDKIFIPFFTTRENGSGIGLSLSRQIIQLHHGYIYLESDENLTKFIIVL